VEKRTLPKRIRTEMRAREMMFRESLRIHAPGCIPATSPDEEKERLRKFQEQEKKKYKAEQQRLDDKHIRQLEETRGCADAAKRELEQLQNEKRTLLTQHEEMKLKELDEECTRILRTHKIAIPPKLEKLESDFLAQLMEQRRFYGDASVPGSGSDNASVSVRSSTGGALSQHSFPTTNSSHSSLESD